MADYAHKETDKIIADTEKKIAKEYKKAHKEVEKKLNDYLKQFSEQLDEKWKLVMDNKMSMKEYNKWRTNKLLTGKRWSDMKDVLAEDYANVAKISQGIVNGHRADVYALNYNHETFRLENGTGIDTSFTLYNREAIERLYRENPKLYRSPSKTIKQQIKEGKLKRWNKQRIQSVLTQGILQGTPLMDIAKELEKVTGSGYKASVRNARTMMTGVQNAGRLDAMERVNNMGIPVKKQWVATLDNHTRHAHRELDGVAVPLDQPFENEVGEINFPGDVEADPENLYNCRCAIINSVEGFERDLSDMSLRYDERLEDMTYEEWKAGKKTAGDIDKPKPAKPNQPLPIANTQESSMRAILKARNVEQKPVFLLNEKLNTADIINRLGGGDLTTGSCASLSLAYAGNRAGLDVRDFRGGESQSTFSSGLLLKGVARLPGVDGIVVEEYNDFKAAHTLLEQVVEGKEYCLGVGRHMAIVRRNGGELEYLELQTQYSNGFHPLDDERLKNRFGCRKSHTSYGEKYKLDAELIEVESLGNNDEFRNLLRFINTDEDKQMKGVRGFAK